MTYDTFTAKGWACGSVHGFETHALAGRVDVHENGRHLPTPGNGTMTAAHIRSISSVTGRMESMS